MSQCPELPPSGPRAAPVRFRYEVGEVLAVGGMGTVHRAFDRLRQRDVAYKRLKDADARLRPVLAARFRFEYDSLVRLSHPNVVEAYDFGFDELGPYYTMELLSGSDLAKSASMPVRDACRVLRDVASALALLHARRLIHRDVTPHNVRLGLDGRAKLIDFGALVPFGTPTEVVGTPAFVAPESFRFVALDQRCDLYGLGALAFWLLTGRTQLRAAKMQEVLEACQLPIAPPSHFTPEVPAPLDELIVSLLSPDPASRPSTAADVIARLTTIADLPPEEDEQRVAFSYLQHIPLRARDDALTSIANAIQRAAAGSGGIVLVEADRGLGRSALLNRVSIDAQLAGATVLRALGTQHGAPFGIARDLLEKARKVIPKDSWRPRSSTSPVQEPGHGGESRSTADASARVDRIAAKLQADLVELSAWTPLVLIVDDAEAMDGESAALFAALVEHVREHAILVVFGAHSGTAWQQAPAYAKLSLNAERIRLAPLTARHVEDLVASMFGDVPNSGPLAAWLYEQTGGNPAHCVDLTRKLLEQQAIRYTVGTFTLPYEFETAFKGEPIPGTAKARLPILGQEIDVALFLALHPAPLSVEQLASLVGRPAPHVLLSLERLAHLGVALREEDSFSCASANVRTALSESSSEQSKREVHVALARLLAREGTDQLATRLLVAKHLLAAGGVEALEGATLLATLGIDQQFDLAVTGAARPLLEEGLRVLRAHGLADTECIALLTALCFTGFFGQIEQLREHFDRTMRALSDVTGLTLAARLSPRVGGALGLVSGMLVGFIRHALTRRKVNRYSFEEHVLLFAALPNIASAAYASAFDSVESYRASTWLDVFAKALPGSAPGLLRELCRATADIASGKIGSAMARYGKVRQRLEQHHVAGLPEPIRDQLRFGCLFGEAQALVANSSPRALDVAAAIDQRGALFSFWVESVRATHHAYRGELAKAAVHRARAESSAFRGGVCWSALSLLTTRWVIACVLTGDVVELIRALADLELLSTLSPGMKAIHQLAQAHLDQLNGRSDRAVAVYEQVLDTELARSLPTYAVERGLHAGALNNLGRHAEARHVCLNTTSESAVTGHDGLVGHVLLIQQLAIAEGRLGDPARGAALLEPYLEQARECGNPLWIGMLHRTAAELAELARDPIAAATHLASASAAFAATGNPRLIHQCEAVPNGSSLTSGLDAATDAEGASPAETTRREPRARARTEDLEGTTESVPAPAS